MGSRNQNPGILLPILSFFFHLVQMYAGNLSSSIEINWEKRLGLLILPYFILAGVIVLLKVPLYQILLSSAQFPIKTNSHQDESCPLVSKPKDRTFSSLQYFHISRLSHKNRFLGFLKKISLSGQVGLYKFKSSFRSYKKLFKAVF